MFFGLLVAAMSLAEYDPLASGPYLVEEAPAVSLQVSHRENDLPVRVRYPNDEGPFPLIVFSHGAGGSGQSLEPLSDLWVSRGFVVMQPTHGDTYADLSRQAKDEYRQGTIGRELTRHWRTRPLDVIAILDQMDEVEKQAKIPGLIDRNRMGHGGHSFGAHTAMLLAGTELKGAGRSMGFEEGRFRCSLLISPQGVNDRSLVPDSWANHEKPTLTISGTDDKGPDPDFVPETRKDPFLHMPPGDKFLVWIEGAEHSFGGINGVRWPGAGPENEEHVDIVRAATTAFWEAYLLDSPEARAYLSEAGIGGWEDVELSSK